MDRLTRELHNGILTSARDTREITKWRKANGYAWDWKFYRGWLQDAREVRLGGTYKGHGERGVRKPKVQRPMFQVVN